MAPIQRLQVPVPSARKGGILYRIGSLGPTGFRGLLLALLLCGPAAAATGPERLVAYLRGLDSLTADFRQITRGADGGRRVESKGTLYLKRPGRFRWEYDSPVEQIIIADGKRVWLHDLELDQVSHQSQGKALGVRRLNCWWGKGPSTVTSGFPPGMAETSVPGPSCGPEPRIPRWSGFASVSSAGVSRPWS